MAITTMIAIHINSHQYDIEFILYFKSINIVILELWATLELQLENNYDKIILKWLYLEYIIIENIILDIVLVPPMTVYTWSDFGIINHYSFDFINLRMFSIFKCY